MEEYCILRSDFGGLFFFILKTWLICIRVGINPASGCFTSRKLANVACLRIDILYKNTATTYHVINILLKLNQKCVVREYIKKYIQTESITIESWY